MQIPETLKILGKTFSVEMVENLRQEDGHSCCGTVGVCDQRIRLNPGYPKECVDSTLLHEIIEAATGLLELGLEHKQISALEEFLYQVLKDNKLHFDE